MWFSPLASTREGLGQKCCRHFLQHSQCFQGSVFILLFSLILLGVSFVLPFTGRLRSENRPQPKVPLLYSLLSFIFRTSLTSPSGFLFGFLSRLKRPSSRRGESHSNRREPGNRVSPCTGDARRGCLLLLNKSAKIINSRPN